MNICSKCGKSEEEIRLYDGIYVNEPIKICERCSLLEGIPIIKSPTTGQLKESEKPGRNKIYDRLKRMSGIKEEQETKSIFEELKELENNPELEKPLDAPLKFVDNFYWVVQRERRRKGLTHKQLAEAIGESETAIKLIERNNLPEDAFKTIKKLEQYFRVRLIKPDPRQELREKKIILERIEGQQAKRVVEDSYTEIILDPDHEKDVQAQLDEDAAIERIKQEHLEKVKASTDIPSIEGKKEVVNNELREVVRQAPAFPRREKEEPAQVLTFKKEKLNKVTISDLQEMNRLVEEDFPTKTSEEVGKEQLEDFGKSTEGDEQRKGWYSNYMKQKIVKREVAVKPIETIKEEPVNDNTPTIHELMEKKKDQRKDEVLVGNEIEIEEIEEI